MFGKRLTVVYAVQYICAIILDLNLEAYAATLRTTTCLSPHNNPVDWFIVYTLPGSHDFHYMDANNKRWRWFEGTALGPDPVYNTLRQLHSGLTYSKYSDQPPQGTVGAHYGHAKGVMAFDRNTGFWMPHSMPKLPPINNGFASVITNAQVFLCISLTTQEHLDIIDAHLRHIRAYSYECNVGASRGLSHCNPQRGTNYYRLGDFIVSLQRTEFLVMAKPRGCFEDIYDDYLVRVLSNDSVFVKSWQRGPGTRIYSNPNVTVQAYNIGNLKFNRIPVQGTSDHSKWAITSRQPYWICIGDLNRMVSQKSRGGGVICFQDREVSESFYNLIVDFDK